MRQTAIPRPANPAGPPRVRNRGLAIATVSLLVAATGLGLWLRLTDLWGWDGTLSIDEARLALAGRGILEHGVPLLPSGWTYTRGLLPAYLVAASFAALGESDFAARLPSVLAGAALVPVTYLLGRVVGGRPGGLFAAYVVAASPPLVFWSRQAWLYAAYVLIYTLALLFIVRAHQSGRARDQLLAGALVGLSFFAHELGVFLLLPLAAQVAHRVMGVGCRVSGEPSPTPDARHPSPADRLAPIASLGIALGAVGLLWLLVASLRAETLVGPYGEVREYFSPHLEAASWRFYGGMLADTRGLILAAAMLGLPLAVAQRRYVALILWLALLPPLLHAALIIPDRPEERYGLTPVVVMLVLAALGVREWTDWSVRRFPRLRMSPDLLTVGILAIILVVHQDVDGALERGALPPSAGAWLAEARGLGLGPANLMMSDLPTVAGWYLGGLDYWPRSRLYQKYTLRGDPSAGSGQAPPREVHTGAVLVRDVGDYQRLVARPNRGRTLWVLASGRTFHWERWIDDDLKRVLERSSRDRGTSPLADGSRILRIDLP